MATIQTSIELELPATTVYNQWTQFEDFPRFMEGVESVQQIDDATLHWIANIGGVRREWDAQIVEQVPDRAIAWRSIEGALNAGMVTFDALDSMRTRVNLHLEFDPEGFVEKAADVLGIVQRRAEGDLERFKLFLEERGAETGGWRGEIEQGETVKPDEPDVSKRITLEPGTEHAEYPQQSPRM